VEVKRDEKDCLTKITCRISFIPVLIQQNVYYYYYFFPLDENLNLPPNCPHPLQRSHWLDKMLENWGLMGFYYDRNDPN